MIVLSSLDAPCAGSVQLASFRILSQEYVKSLIGKSSKKTCSLDPIPTPLVVDCLDALLPAITRMINLYLQGRTFPDNWKLADVKLRLKKTGVDALFTNLRPISNLSFASKLTEKAVFAQMHKHLTTSKLYLKAQSAYREFHSTETTLLQVKNDILLNMNQHVTLLVLLDLSAAFDHHQYCSTVSPGSLALRDMCTLGLSLIFIADSSPSPSIPGYRMSST